MTGEQSNGGAIAPRVGGDGVPLTGDGRDEDGQCAQGGAVESVQRAQGRGLGEELHSDVPAPGADCLARPDADGLSQYRDRGGVGDANDKVLQPVVAERGRASGERVPLGGGVGIPPAGKSCRRLQESAAAFQPPVFPQDTIPPD